MKLALLFISLSKVFENKKLFIGFKKIKLKYANEKQFEAIFGTMFLFQINLKDSTDYKIETLIHHDINHVILTLQNIGPNFPLVKLSTSN